MSVFIVTYDLNRETVRPPLLKKLKDTYPNWAKLSESSYAVSTSSTAQQIHDTVRPLLDSNDNIYVISLRKPYAGFGPPEVNRWLEANLTY